MRREGEAPTELELLEKAVGRRKGNLRKKKRKKKNLALRDFLGEPACPFARGVLIKIITRRRNRRNGELFDRPVGLFPSRPAALCSPAGRFCLINPL